MTDEQKQALADIYVRNTEFKHNRLRSVFGYLETLREEGDMTSARIAFVLSSVIDDYEEDLFMLQAQVTEQTKQLEFMEHPQ